MNFNAAIIEAAGRHLGVQEWPGAKSNPAVEVFFARAGHPGLTDDVPWCAAFVGAVLAECGVNGTGSLMARSYSRWGQPVSRADAMPGDVVVFPRGKPPSGHVGFFVRYEGDRVIIRGGNQSNKVNDASYPAATILHIRRADPVVSTGRATLRAGDKGAMVLDLQDQLARLGYFSGKKDGDFGPLTRAAVLAFQADNQLETDGVVGTRTWKALASAVPRALRDVTKDDLVNSRTIRTAGEGKGVTAITTAVAGAGAAVGAAEQAYDVAQRAGGLAQGLGAMAPWLLLMAAVAIGGWMIWRRFNRIENIRLDDAQTGANDSR